MSIYFKFVLCFSSLIHFIFSPRNGTTLPADQSSDSASSIRTWSLGTGIERTVCTAYSPRTSSANEASFLEWMEFCLGSKVVSDILGLFFMFIHFWQLLACFYNFINLLFSAKSTKTANESKFLYKKSRLPSERHSSIEPTKWNMTIIV